MNEDRVKRFATISKRLKTELNLMDSEEYYRMKRQEAIARKKQLLDSFKKSLDDFTLTQEEREIIEPPEDEEVRQEPLHNNAPIEALLAAFQNNNEESVSEELESRFYGQSNEVQMRIIKAFLNGNEDNRKFCYWLLLEDWWDDAVIPDIEKLWETYREPQCLRVMAHRFPLSFVLAHQEEIAKENYLWLCLRLASEKGFVIDKTKLTRKQYGRILASNRIHLSDDEADDLLFGYIIAYLSPYNSGEYIKYLVSDFIEESVSSEYKPTRRFDDDIRFLFGNYNNLEKCLSGFLNYKPSLIALPDMKYLIWVLKHTGNITTLKKFLLWNKNIQQHIPPLWSEDDCQALTIQLLEDRYKAYLDESWEQLKSLAIVTFPIDVNNITYEFRVNTEEDRCYESYDPY
jgi:hypothetical protein